MLFDLQSAAVVLLYPFRCRDLLTGKWVRARYKATKEEIKARYAEWEVNGPAEVRLGGVAGGAYFHPFPSVAPIAELPPEMQPVVDAIETSLVLMFLRRYVTWCARRRQFAAMEGAARLHRELER